ncbi:MULTISPECIES: response regulator transcription factor [Malaciobacter]|jgi:DNA-binding response OmpR family regulator|uniref:DNA-binding response OmpR family regulator n=2 Tax=Malaciobacter TaxID=2321114 RepID=A0AB36ZW96_9BACT|nr:MULTISPECIES: response regulator [Malaciobacter]PHO09830.1 DNA-binding response regulator [Malaciobacter canalis]PPK60203.1 DNA-binding response OmpR family regulator [Malaciobacter marinus]QEE33450.1 two-component system response regulator [Malaciobacter canalis]SKB72092.1 DNA-binding response regulator, OmpR family, contains REC and winged-helix (wHTH) domain [Malaciobacter marinus]
MNQDLIKQLSSFNLLYVEDEDGIRNNIFEILRHMFKNLYLAKNAKDAYKLYQDKKPDLIITDIRMPKESGIDLIKKIRKTDSKVRVIITSAHTDLEYMLEATELHLVKYIIKPITEAKLTEALEAFIKSYAAAPVYNLIPKWIYDESKSCVTGPDVEHILTKKENAFLKLLINKNRIITYQEMETQIWDDANVMTPNAMRLFIKNFRKKLPKGILKNIQGTGYRLVT